MTFPSSPGPLIGTGYGGIPYGTGGYGSGHHPRAPVSVDGGYGGSPYGHAPYGSIGYNPPVLANVRSLNGTQIEIAFNESVDWTANATLASSYTLTPVFGAPATILIAAVSTESTVLITHTGTTLGGQYLLTVNVNVTLPPLETGRNTAYLLTFGEDSTVTAIATDGSHVLIETSAPILLESEWPPGAGDPASYLLDTTYPIAPNISAVEHPFEEDQSKILLTVSGMTSVNYNAVVGVSGAVFYDATTYPNFDDSFDGVVVGVGATNVDSGRLILSKSTMQTYGWSFGDLTGRMTPGCTFRADVSFNATEATLTPPLSSGTVARFGISDGSVQLFIALSRVSGFDVLDITSGAFATQVPATWSAGETTLSVLRNARGDFVTVLLDGVPLITFDAGNLAGPSTIPTGLQFTLTAGTMVNAFPVLGLQLTASNTLYTTAWNFLHGLISPFVGSAASARSTLRTQHGPLVRNWGDWTPATAADVAVRLNGVSVDVEGVNSYTGEITLSTPIPLFEPGSNNIEIDYAWMKLPIFPIIGLNTVGLTLNKWDIPVGQRNATTLGSGGRGAMSTGRFRYGAVLPPIRARAPIQTSHRFIAFDAEYTARTNDNGSLRLNKSPLAFAQGDLVQSHETSQISYEGLTSPVADGWTLSGSDSGSAEGGSYTIVLNSNDTPAIYWKAIDLKFPAAVMVAAQLQARTWLGHGVYVGPSVGMHDNNRLYLAGLLFVESMQHVGILLDSARPDLAASWEIGPAVSIKILGATTFYTESSTFATAQVRGTTTRFRVAVGPQAGTYTVANCSVSTSRTGFIGSILESFPESPDTYGAESAVALLEVAWDQPILMQLAVNPVERSATLIVSGVIARSNIMVTNVSTAIEPALTAGILPVTDDGGAVFWGNGSRGPSGASSTWAYVRGFVQPNIARTHYRGATVTVPTTETPDEAVVDPWFVEDGHGWGSVDSALQVINHTAATVAGTSFSYARIEPFLTVRTVATMSGSLQVDSYSGSGGAQILLSDGRRDVIVATLAYAEGGVAPAPYRRLVSMPTVSITNLVLPESEGWSKIAIGTATSLLIDAVGRGLRVDHATLQHVFWAQPLSAGEDGTEDVVADVVFSTSLTTILPGEGPLLSVPAGGGRTVVLGLASAPARVVLLNGSAIAASFAFAWNDGNTHQYRVITNEDTDTVSVLADNVLLGVAALSAFPTTGDRGVVFGIASPGDGTTIWRSAAAHPVPNTHVKQTLGMRSNYWAANPADINGWIIPRTDSTGAKNSSAAALPVVMDWTSTLEIQVVFDTTWGAKLYRSDISATTVQAVVEYPRLPRSTSGVGHVAFGAVESSVLSKQSWGDVTYRIATTDSASFIAPQKMTLNRSNVLTSGELLQDKQPEIVVVPVDPGGMTISLRAAHIHFARIYSIILGSVIVASDEFVFDEGTQTITLASPVPTGLSNATVTGVAGVPVTNTYLCSQPFAQGTTILNENTPPFSATQALDRSIVSTEVCNVDSEGQTNLLSPFCDGDHLAFELQGTAFSEQRTFDGGPAIWGGAGSIKDTVGGFSQQSVLMTYGGAALPSAGTVVLNRNITLPNYPSLPGPDRGAVIRASVMRLQLSSVVNDATADPVAESDLADVYGGASDNTPASHVEGTVVPAGTPAPSGNGACAVLLVDGATATYGRVGPWGGLSALQTRSLLGGGVAGVGMVLSGGAPLGGAETVTRIAVQAP